MGINQEAARNMLLQEQEIAKRNKEKPKVDYRDYDDLGGLHIENHRKGRK